MDEDLSHLLGIFRQELTDYVQGARRNLSELERVGFDAELVHDTFRCLHNLKGAAAAIGLESLSGLAHSMETLLAAVRKRELELSAPLYGLLYEGAEHLETLIEGENPALVEGFERRAAELPRGSAPEAAPTENAPAIRRAVVEETVRTPVAKLDRLIAESTQLLAQRTRLERRLEEVRELAGLLARLAREHPELRPAVQAVASLDRQLLADTGALRATVTSVVAHAQSLRMLPLTGLFEAVGQHARDLARKQGKTLLWTTVGDHLEIDRYVLESLKDPLLHLARNAVDHGLADAGSIWLTAEPAGSQLRLTLRDDGVGLDPDRLRRRAEELGLSATGDVLDLIFLPGFSTRVVADEVSGRGVGLDVVRSRVEQLGGQLRVESEPGQGLAMILTVPLSLSSTRVLVVVCGDQRFGLPLASVERTLRLTRERTRNVQGQLVAEFGGRAHPVQPLLALLGQSTALPTGLWSTVLLAHGEERWLAVVDEVCGEEEVVVRPLGARLRRLPGLAGGALEAAGSVLLVLNVADFGQRAQRTASPELAAPPPARRVLVVDDSFTTRTLEKNLLEAAGYLVHLACDGQEGLAMARDVRPDLILSDIEMPRCDGFQFTRNLREDATLQHLPVILVSSLDSPEIFRAGTEAGANAYVVKGRFDQGQFLQLVRELIER